MYTSVRIDKSWLMKACAETFKKLEFFLECPFMSLKISL